MQQSKEVMNRGPGWEQHEFCVQTYSSSALGLLGRFFLACADNTD